MASRDDKRYVLNGVRFEEVTMVAAQVNRERRALRFEGCHTSRALARRRIQAAASESEFAV